MFWEQRGAIGQVERDADAQRRAGNYARAKSLYTCLIAMIKKAHGPVSEKLAINFYRLGETYSEAGEQAAGRIYYKRAADIWLELHKGYEKNPLWSSQSMQEIHDSSEIDEADRVAGERRRARNEGIAS